MSDPDRDLPAGRPTLTLRGCLEGARLTVPALPGLVVYGMAFGAAASQRGLSFGEGMAMSAFVYAGAAQMLSLELWRGSWTPALILTVALVTATVNARFLLMGAALQPWLRGAPPVRIAAGLFFLVDVNWLVAARYREAGGRDLGVLFGAGIVSWICWVAATAPGYLGGATIGEPRRFALDLVMPIFFAIMGAALWRGVAVSGLSWLVAASVALGTQALVPGFAFIVAGALAGAVTAALGGRPPVPGPDEP